MNIDQPLHQIIDRQKTGGRFQKDSQKSSHFRGGSRNVPNGRRQPVHNNTTSRECKFFNKPEGCQAINCGFEHRLIPGVSFCQYYNTPEGCRRGNTCGFVHSPLAVPSLPQTRAPSRSTTTTTTTKQPQATRPPEGPRFKQLCHFYNSPSGCKVGNQCGFMHKEIKPFVTECHFFNTERGCTAPQCGFVHVSK